MAEKHAKKRDLKGRGETDSWTLLSIFFVKSSRQGRFLQKHFCGETQARGVSLTTEKRTKKRSHKKNSR
jgi:hypothetical protein